ncbi:hypothetical protein [Hymenobacter jeollabukensis]|uniref:Uncharacterized protein n=1 Tax=Hymenobacter jeollabukensis TaxID=2025313 RepID=A0A5R8WHE5_9BACT|nr:hypothetical protein [Hymenobacter jeollabukensis]TLM87878.1 hypothetical protein FDY95_24870 [Hymenobacter jeollabukensis]
MSTLINGSDATASTTKTVRRTAQLPTKDVPLGILATTVAEKWRASPLPPLMWLSKDNFAAQVAAFVLSHKEADDTGDARTPQSKRLKVLDKTLDTSLRYVKGYLEEEYDDHEGYYGEFGIEKQGKNYKLPLGRPERVKALGKLLAALRKHKFDKKKYGTAYWQPLYDEYQPLVADSNETTGQRSGLVDQKDQGAAQVRKGLRSIIHHVKANYPDTWEAELRGFGFLKESFGG